MKLSDIFTNQITPGRLFNIPEQPHNVILDLTTACNNKCIFCYNSNSYIKRNGNSDPKKLLEIVKLLGQTGTKEILYLGGEPISSPYILKILSEGKKNNVFQRVVSNGSYYKDIDFCRELKNIGLDETGISFHSSDEQTHDKLAGRTGAFKDAMKGIEKCLEAGISVFIQYSPNRLNNINDVIEFGWFIRNNYGNEIKLFDINRLLPLGKGLRANDIIFNKGQWFEFLVLLTQLSDMNFEVRVELTPFCWLDKMKALNKIDAKTLEKIYKFNRGCFMWIAQLPLDCNGYIKFCPAGEKVGPSILEVNWPEYWETGEIYHPYRSFNWNLLFNFIN